MVVAGWWVLDASCLKMSDIIILLLDKLFVKLDGVGKLVKEHNKLCDFVGYTCRKWQDDLNLHPLPSSGIKFLQIGGISDFLFVSIIVFPCVGDKCK